MPMVTAGSLANGLSPTTCQFTHQAKRKPLRPCREELSYLDLLVSPEGVEPPTFWFVAKRSIQLSYGDASIRPRFSGESAWIIAKQATAAGAAPATLGR